MASKRDNWRFRNLASEFTDIMLKIDECLKKDDAWGKHFRNWKGILETPFGGGDLLNLCYAYGMTQAKICKMARWDLMFYLKEATMGLTSDESWLFPPKEFPHIHLGAYGMAMMLADSGFIGDISGLIEKAKVTQDISDDMTIPEHFMLVHKIVLGHYDSERESISKKTLAFSDVPFSRHISYLGLRDEEKFNQAIKVEVEEFNKPLQTRNRMRNVLPHNMVSLHHVNFIALALEAGLRFTYFDPALPIWDFPIAQRPEIQKLLTPEMIERIPDPSVFQQSSED